MPIPHVLITVALSFEIRKRESSSFVFLFQNCFGHSGSFEIAYEF